MDDRHYDRDYLRAADLSLFRNSDRRDGATYNAAGRPHKLSGSIRGTGNWTCLDWNGVFGNHRAAFEEEHADEYWRMLIVALNADEDVRAPGINQSSTPL